MTHTNDRLCGQEQRVTSKVEATKTCIMFHFVILTRCADVKMRYLILRRQSSCVRASALLAHVSSNL